MPKNSENCPQCGTTLPSNAPAGLCPRCVMAMNMATDTQLTGDGGPHGTQVLKNAPTPEELAAGFPQLEILELLGRGGMGAVYKVRQKELDRIVALKILPPGISGDPAFAERFSREAKALAKLNHPNIVTLYEFGRVQSGTCEAPVPLYYFLMEYVDGVNLRQLLDTGRVSSREALAIVPQICDALQFAHDHGIVHRDIKPENILMDRRGKVKVADFGLAKIIEPGRADLPVPQHMGAEPQHGPTGVMGTPHYMAPEQQHSPLDVDHRADIYALGVVFYQMLTGELPGKRIEAPSKKVRIDVRLDEIVLRALENKPEFRYQSAEEFKTRVETMGEAPPSRAAAAPRKTKRRSMALACLYLLGAGCALVNMGYTLSESDRVDWVLAYGWGVGAFGLLILGVHCAFAARSKANSERFSAPSGEPEIEAPDSGRLATSPSQSNQHRGMPAVIWIALAALAIVALSNLVLIPRIGPVAFFEAVFKVLIIAGLWHRLRVAYLLTIVSAFFAWPIAFKLSAPYGLLLTAMTLMVIVPLLAGMRWFFPAEISRLSRRVWLGATTVLSILAFAVMMTAPIPENLRGASQRSSSAAGINSFPTSLNHPIPSTGRGFGPVIELVVESGIDFDTGTRKHLPLPQPLGDRDQARYDWFDSKESGPWMREHGVDAVNGNHALMSKDLMLVKLEKKDWDTLSPDKLRQKILAQAPATDSFNASSSKTFGFKTREGGIGTVQITGERYAPGITNTMLPGVKIRYKLVRDNLAELGLEPKTKFAATLADGSFVELVSLMYGSEPRRAAGQTNEIEWFWNPDGTPSIENIGWSFGAPTLSSTRDPSLDYRKFVARWGGPGTNNAQLMGWQLDENPPDSADGQFTITPKSESAENWIGLMQGFPQNKKMATIRFALVSGPYVTGPKPNFLWSSSDKTPYGSFSIGKIFDHNGNAAVTLTHNLKGCDYRLQTHIPEPLKPTSTLGKFVWNWKQKYRRDQPQIVYGRVVKGGAFSQTFEFPGVPAKEAMVTLPRIRFEVRSVQWVEFQNVALNPGEETRVQIQVNEAAEKPPANDVVAFGPVIERTVNDIDEKLGKECLALESSELIDFNETEIKALPKGEQAKWFDDRSVNVLMDTVGGKRGLGLRNVTVTLVSKDGWDWDRVALEKAICPNEPGVEYKDRGGFRWHLMATNTLLPMTFALQTRSGRLGVLQVLSFTDDPGGVKIRYKLVRNNLPKVGLAPNTDAWRFEGTEIEAIVLQATNLWNQLTPSSYDTVIQNQSVKIFRQPKVKIPFGQDTSFVVRIPRDGSSEKNSPTEWRVTVRQTSDGNAVLYSVKGHFSKTNDVWISPEKLSETTGRVNLDSPMVFGLLPRNVEPATALVLTFRPVREAVPDLGSSSTVVGGRFSDVFERTLSDPDNFEGKSNRETLDLKTGELLNALGDAPKENEGRLGDLLASEGDLYAEYDDYVSKKWALVTVGLKLSDVLKRDWDNSTALVVEEALKEPTSLERAEHFGVTLHLLPEEMLPLTLAFESRDGARGLLQITKFEDNPRSLRLRYKLLQNAREANVPSRLKPIPREAAKLLEDTKALYQSHNRSTDSNAEIEFHKKLLALTKETNATLKGTIAEPLLKEQELETVKMVEAKRANDPTKEKEAMERLQILGLKLVEMIHPNAEPTGQ